MSLEADTFAVVDAFAGLDHPLLLRFQYAFDATAHYLSKSPDFYDRSIHVCRERGFLVGLNGAYWYADRSKDALQIPIDFLKQQCYTVYEELGVALQRYFGSRYVSHNVYTPIEEATYPKVLQDLEEQVALVAKKLKVDKALIQFAVTTYKEG